MKTISRKTILMTGILIFLGSLCLRTALISKGPYHADTMALIELAEKTLDTHQLHKQSALGFPFIVLLASGFIFLFKLLNIGTTALAVNTISVLFSSFAVFAMYLLSLEFFEFFNTEKNETFRRYQWGTAILSSVLLSISPIFLGISVYGKSHAPCLFFLLAGIFSLLRFLRLGKRNEFWASIIWLGLCGATRILDLILLAIPLSFLFIGSFSSQAMNPRKKKKASLLIQWWAGIGLMIFFFYLPYFLQSQASNFFPDLNKYLDHALIHNFMGLFSHKLLLTFHFLVKNFTYSGIFLSVIGLFYIFKFSSQIGTFLLLWILFPLFFYGNLLMTMTSRYFVIILPPMIFAMAFLFSNFQNKKLFFKSIACILFIGISVTVFMRIYPLLQRRHQYADVPEFVQWFKQTAEPNAQIIHGDGSLFFRYYGNVTVARRPLSSQVYSEEELQNFQKGIDALLQQNVPVYINSIGLFAYNRKESFSKFIEKNYTLDFFGSHPYEDWHGGAMEDRRINLNVYKLSIKHEN